MEKIRVFMSSTQKDLQPERDAVESVIGKLGYECLRAESHSAPGKSPKEACCDMARICDIYVGVYGKSHGSIDSELGLSITEMEFNEAKAENSRKVMIYIKKQDEYEPRQQEFLKRVQDFSTGYFRHERFETLEHLQWQVESDLITWVAERVHQAVALQKEAQALRLKVQTLQSYYRQLGEQQNIPREILL